jgi:Domain of unknown function (DUF2017)
MSALPFAPAGEGRVELQLAPRLREILAELCDGLAHLLATEQPSSDTALARLFPAAYPDDPLRELEFERLSADDLARGRLASIERMRATIDAEVLDAEDALAWLRTLNDVRLVLGDRIELTEESRPEDFAADDAAAHGFALYDLLTDLLDLLLVAIDPAVADPYG